MEAVNENQTHETGNPEVVVSKSTTIALPRTVEALMANRKKPMKTTLNDQVDAIHLQLWTDERYQALLDAVDHSGAVEGNFNIDDTYAAQMIRDHARENGVPYVANQKIATLVRALKIVMRRYGISRKERGEA